LEYVKTDMHAEMRCQHRGEFAESDTDRMRKQYRQQVNSDWLFSVQTKHRELQHQTSFLLLKIGKGSLDINQP